MLFKKPIDLKALAQRVDRQFETGPFEAPPPVRARPEDWGDLVASEAPPPPRTALPPPKAKAEDWGDLAASAPAPTAPEPVPHIPAIQPAAPEVKEPAMHRADHRETPSFHTSRASKTPDLSRVVTMLEESLLAVENVQAITCELRDNLYGENPDPQTVEDSEMATALVPRLMQLAEAIKLRASLAQANALDLRRLC